MDTLTVLRKARAHISARERWTTGMLCDSRGRVCAMGAVAEVLFGNPEAVRYFQLKDVPAVKALADASDPNWRKKSPLDATWTVQDANDLVDIELIEPDSPEHHAKVLALFDRAIAAEEAKLTPPEIVPQATPRRRDDVGCETRERVAA